MKCELSEKLIPLFIGGDLEPREADELRHHIETCAACSRLTEDFQASRKWLSAAFLPDIDEASFANLRASVLRQIEEQQSAGSWIDWLLPKWNTRFVLAASAAALVLITGLVAAAYLNQPSPERKGGETIARGNDQTSAPINGGPISDTTGNQHLATQLAQHEAIRTNATSRTVRRSNRAAIETTTLPAEAFQTDSFGQPPEELLPAEDPVVAADTVPSEPEVKEMMRIELQTADPNIRIIWFTPKSDNSSNTKTK